MQKDGEELRAAMRAQEAGELFYSLGFFLIKGHPFRSGADARVSLLAVDLVDGLEPIEDALLGVWKQAQRIGAKGMAGIINKALPLADIGDGLFFLRGKIFRHRHREGSYLATYKVRCVGDRTIGIIHDAYALTRAAQSRAMAGTQRRPRTKGSNGLGAYICHPSP